MIDINSKQPDIVFILGIMPRSGTHFLANLLCQHPDCKKSEIAEDALLATSGYLSKYVNVLHSLWKEQKELPNLDTRCLLRSNIGNGLVDFLREARAKLVLENKSSALNEKFKYLITKTPQVAHVNHFFDFFPDQKLIILVRDGRSLTESIYLSFEEPYETAMKNWSIAANRIIEFEQQWKTKRNYLIVKYEDLHEHTERELKRILAYLELDAEKYNFQAAVDLPVTGSSSFKRGNGAVHWMPVRKTTEFDPLNRAAGWTRSRHERFNWLAQKQLIYFGYKPVTFTGNHTYWVLYNKALDGKEKLRRKLAKLKTWFTLLKRQGK